MPEDASQTALVQSVRLQTVPNYGLVWPNAFGSKSYTYRQRIWRRVFRSAFDSD